MFLPRPSEQQRTQGHFVSSGPKTQANTQSPHSVPQGLDGHSHPTKKASLAKDIQES